VYAGGFSSATGNTYNGGTYVEGSGTLQVGSPTALGTGGLTADAGRVDLAGFSPTIASLSGAAGVITNSSTTASTLTVSQAATTTFSGTLQNGSGPVSLVMDGEGTLILAGSDSYSGGTTVAAGMLEITTSHALPAGSVLIVGGGGTFVFGPSAAGSPVREAAPGAAPAVPEPGTLALLIAALAVGFGAWRRRIGS
jgi:autotransporter-associated beta strand protein